MQLPDELRRALDDKVIVHLATIMPDGSPHVSAIWVGREGDTILFSTADGRVKTANIRRDPRVGLSFTTVDDDYKNWVLRGTVTRFVTDGFWLIDDLARTYTDADRYEWATPDQVRVNGTIEITSIASN